MKIKGMFALTIVLVMGCATVAMGYPLVDPVFPWGTNPSVPPNPHAGQPVNSFCDAQQAIMDNSLLASLPPEFAWLTVFLAPGTGDLNGTSYIILDPTTFSLNGNGLLDCSIELKLIEQVLKDTAFSVNGLTHANVLAAMNHNCDQFNIDLGATYWSLAPVLLNGLPQVLLGHALIGDGTLVKSEPVATPIGFNRFDINGSGAFIEGVLIALVGAGVVPAPIPPRTIDMHNYTRMPQYFSKDGDADGDGVTNLCEYRVYGAANYVANALNPAVTPTQAQVDDICNATFRFASIRGGGFHEEGSALNLAVTVANETPPVTYQWSKNGVDNTTATTATFTIPVPTVALDSGIYRCIATDMSPGKIVIDTGPIPVTVVLAGALPVASLIGLGITLTVLLGGGTLVVRRGRKS